VAVWALALLAMFAYPPLIHTKAAGYGQTKWAYGWVWEDGSIDTARLGIQCFLVSGVAGLLIYVLRPAGIQAIARRKKLVIVSAMVAGMVGSMVFLSLWWYSLPPAQVSKISTELIHKDIFDLVAKEPKPVAIPGLPEIDSSWWRDPDALVKHMQLRIAMSDTNPQASVSTWLQRHDYFDEQPVQWKVTLADEARSFYVDKDTASIEYYKCLGDAKKISANRQLEDTKDKAETYEFFAADERREAKAWKVLMDAGGGLSMYGWTGIEREKGIEIHLVIPGERSAAAYYVGNRAVLVQGRIVALNAGLISPYVVLRAALTGKATSLSAD